MHIKNIHSMIEKLSECAKCELDKGIEKINTKEMAEVAEMIKELSEAEYYAKISKAMDESEYGVDYDYMGAYDEHERKGYRGQPRDSRGRYISRRGRRMGYEEPMMMYDEDWEEMERMRDLDRGAGKMYYSGGGSSSGSSGGSSGSQSSGGMSSGSQGGQSSSSSGGGSRGYSESRYENAKRGYQESKEMKDGGHMKSLEEYSKELTEDVMDMVKNMDSGEKQMIRTKLQTLASKIT